MTCTPKLPDGVTDPFGPGGFDGVMNDDGKGNITFEFACSSSTATTGATTIPGPLNVSGTLYVHAGS